MNFEVTTLVTTTVINTAKETKQLANNALCAEQKAPLCMYNKAHELLKWHF